MARRMQVRMKFEEIKKPINPISDTFEVVSVITMQKPSEARKLQRRSRVKMYLRAVSGRRGMQ